MVGRDVAEVFIEAEKGTWENSDTNTKGKKIKEARLQNKHGGQRPNCESKPKVNYLNL